MTGATGLIGREVGKRLVEQGHQLVVLSRNPSSARLELPFPAQVFQWDGSEAPPPVEAWAGVDGVVHLAGEPIAEGRWTAERKRRIRDSRVEGTRQLVDSIFASPEICSRMKFFVLGSAIGFYGDRSDEVLDEDSATGEGFLAEVVREWEAQADRLLELRPEAQIRITKIRTGVVFARHGGAIAKMLPVFSRGLGGKLSSGDQWMSWIHLDDIARLFCFAATDSRVSGVINGVAPDAVRNDRLTIELARALHRSVFLPVPRIALRVAFGEMADTLLGSQRVLPRRALELGFEFRYRELTTALNELAEPLREFHHELLAEQWVPMTPEEIFPYFCSEKNLEELTPAFLGFNVLGKSTDLIEQGTEIDYRLSLHGIPLKWRTLIESWRPGVSFVDTQLKGPYRKWHHTHEFIPFAGGTLMRDRVIYKLPLGIIGDLSAGWKVARDVATIFAYRRKKIGEMFAGK